MEKSELRFYRLCWITFFVLIAVILWGAVVRATGSGAGCGSHWPLCNGQVLPQEPGVKTLIEFIHRATSGLSLMLVVFAWLWGRSIFRTKPEIKAVLNFSVVAMLLEAALGAGLVLLEHVGVDKSSGRVISISLHLINTTFLMAAWISVIFGAKNSGRVRLHRNSAFHATFGLFLLTGVTGAITALGDTLFPAETLIEGFKQDFLSGAHITQKLRVFHPLGAFLFATSVVIYVSGVPKASRARLVLIVSVLAQLAVGMINLALMAPVVLQMIHLALANFVLASLWWSALRAESTTQDARRET